MVRRRQGLRTIAHMGFFIVAASQKAGSSLPGRGEGRNEYARGGYR
jgi:hypothetical protein